VEGIINYKLFLLASFAIVALPGQDFLYVTTRGIALGKRAGVISACGISIGLLVHTLLAALGLSIIIQASTTIYSAIQYFGAAYLIFLGAKTFLSKGTLYTDTKETTINTKSIFMQGILTNIFNPKAILVFIAFLPQFIDEKLQRPVMPLLFLGFTLCVIAVLWFSLIGYFAGAIGAAIRVNKLAQRIIRGVSGSILILLGIRLAMQEK